jgi:hypothetical protein
MPKHRVGIPNHVAFYGCPSANLLTDECGAYNAVGGVVVGHNRTRDAASSRSGFRDRVAALTRQAGSSLSRPSGLFAP